MRYVIARRAEIDRLEHRIRRLEVEAARHEWLKASHRALERSHDAALSWIRSHRCSPVALPAAAVVPLLTEVDRGTD
jgi:hypothetical protein